ncbi:MAG: hypothetical protein KGL39_03880 [Patescibacteria group bacterium]|nr:hypothetical protein [Patescibacteria group bacterium]
MSGKLTFLWNGIKDGSGKLHRCWYSNGALLRHPPGTISIHAKDYARFSADIRACFEVENNTDMMTDYFDTDTIRVVPDHPLYSEVIAAQQACEVHRGKMRDKRVARRQVA